MKKAILVLLLSAGACHLKAQQLFGIKPVDSLGKRSLDSYFKVPPQPDGNFFKPLNLTQAAIKSQHFYSAMPVAVLKGNDAMPVAVLRGHDNMSIKHIDLENGDVAVTGSLPGQPTFIGPYQPIAPVQKN